MTSYEKILALDQLLKTRHELNLAYVWKTKEEEYQKLIGPEYASGKKKYPRPILRKTARFFDLDASVLFDNSTDLPDASTIVIPDENLKEITNSTYRKIVYLNDYLKTRYLIDLPTVLGFSKKSFEHYLKKSQYLYGKTPLPTHLVKKTGVFFAIQAVDLRDPEVDLPTYDQLMVNENIIKVQKDEWEIELKKNQNRHVVQRNNMLLSHAKKVSLFFKSLILIIPLVGYATYCTYTIWEDNLRTTAQFRQDPKDTLSEDQQAYAEKLQKHSRTNSANTDHILPDNYWSLHQDTIGTSAYFDGTDSDSIYYVPVKVGIVVSKISNISPTADSFQAKFDAWYKFDEDEFKTMLPFYFKEYTGSLVSSGNGAADDADIKSIVESRDKASTYYPYTISALRNSNQVSVVGGTITSTEYPVPTVYYTEKDVDGNTHNMVFCKVRYTATVNHDFSSIRYPLEALELSVGLESSMDSIYIRFEPDETTQTVNVNGVPTQVEEAGFSTGFTVGSGFRPIKGDHSFGMTQTSNRFVTNNPTVTNSLTYHTQANAVMRFNRSGIGLFLQAFVNLFAVVIWIIIAFFDASFNKEDSIGMLGTGLFGAISSVIVGISLLADSAVFSLITMIDIFTLAVILSMTVICIKAKRARVKDDAVAIAYSTIQLRIMFWVLTILTIVMFVLLPLSAYCFLL